MLQTVGTSVCMAGGNLFLMNVADMVCPPVMEDGLSYAFEKLELV